MAEVNIIIDGRPFGIACDPGQEQRVEQLGSYIEERLQHISGGAGTSNKSQLMVLTALVLADEIFDLRDHLHRVANTNVQQQPSVQPEPEIVQPIYYEGLTPQDESGITSAIATLAARVEKLTRRVQKA